jgi:hypothetical protein
MKGTEQHIHTPRGDRRRRSGKLLLCGLLLLALALVYLAAYQRGEPFYNNDETRHVMTGVYFKDLLRDFPLTHARDYTVNYYLQYPALGLLVWPPLFYFMEGLLMSIFGTSLVVPKALVCFFALMACVYLFRLVSRTHDRNRAALSVLILGLAPLVFELSHYVMLEVPTLALSLAATYHFVSYLEDARQRDLLFAALFSALSALTRFDAIYLLPLFLILLAARRRWELLKRGEVLIAAALALALVAPFYLLSASGIGWMHFKFVTETLSPDDPAFLSLSRLFFYPSRLPLQLGVIALIPEIVGLICSLRDGRRAASWIYLAIVVAVYVTFTPMGELQSRHAVYWIPAFAFFAADGVARIIGWLRMQKLYVPLAACVLLSLVWSTLAQPLKFVRGYEEAARYVATNSATSPFCLFVGTLNGNFIYQMRRQDPERRLWILRADKLLFSILIVPGIEYRQPAESEEGILDAIFKYDPEFIVVEGTSPPSSGSLEDEMRIRFEQQVKTIIGNHPERFRLEKTISVESNEPGYQGMQLKVFRNILRNENPERRLEVDLLMLRRSVETTVP